MAEVLTQEQREMLIPDNQILTTRDGGGYGPGGYYGASPADQPPFNPDTVMGVSMTSPGLMAIICSDGVTM
jgi:hypothetical protein